LLYESCQRKKMFFCRLFYTRKGDSMTWLQILTPNNRQEFPFPETLACGEMTNK
jgi:hypothetical protein